VTFIAQNAPLGGSSIIGRIGAVISMLDWNASAPAAFKEGRQGAA